MPRRPMTDTERAEAAERLSRGRLTAQTNRAARIALGEKAKQTPKQKARLRKMNAARKAKAAALNDAITAALAPVAVKKRDHAGEITRAAGRRRHS